MRLVSTTSPQLPEAGGERRAGRSEVEKRRPWHGNHQITGFVLIRSARPPHLRLTSPRKAKRGFTGFSSNMASPAKRQRTTDEKQAFVDVCKSVRCACVGRCAAARGAPRRGDLRDTKCAALAASGLTVCVVRFRPLIEEVLADAEASSFFAWTVVRTAASQPFTESEGLGSVGVPFAFVGCCPARRLRVLL